jgi:hypothetical protein
MSDRDPIARAVRRESLDAMARGDELHDGQWVEQRAVKRLRRRSFLRNAWSTVERVIFWSLVAGFGLGMLLVAESLI